MIRFPMLLFIASSILLAAGSPDLLIAVRNGDYAEAQKLLRTGADVNTADGDGTTALMHSVIESDLRMMKLLIGARANANAKNALDSTALMYASTNLGQDKSLVECGSGRESKGSGRRHPDECRSHSLRIDSSSKTPRGQRG